MSAKLRAAHAAAQERALQLSKRDINRSIAIDFEGRGRSQGQVHPPDFLGWLVGRHNQRLQGRVLREEIKFLAHAARRRCRDVRFDTLRNCILSIAKTAEQESRVLLFYSQHEVEMLHRELPTEEFDRVAPLLADGKHPIDRHLKAKGLLTDDNKRNNGLKLAAELLCEDLARKQEKVEVGKFFKGVRDSVAKRRQPKFGHLRDSQKEAWADLLDYNFYDLALLHECAHQAARAKNRASIRRSPQPRRHPK